MLVSVVIPVHNVRTFIEKAVSSALMQPETGEVIIVDDKSTDGTFDLCMELAAKDSRVKVYQHPDKQNHGAAVSRNLGISKTTCEFVAFLDSDDFFLPGRFPVALDILEKHPEADGVYEAIGTYSYNEESFKLHKARMEEANSEDVMLTTMADGIKPGELLEALLLGKKGWFHFNGLTLRRRAFDKAGVLDNELWYDEDNEFFYRLAHRTLLIPGRLKEPVAMRGVHPKSRTLMPEEQVKMKYYHILTWEKMFRLMLNDNLTKRLNRHIVNQKLNYYNRRIVNMEIGMPRKVYKLYCFVQLVSQHPKCIGKLF